MVIGGAIYVKLGFEMKRGSDFSVVMLISHLTF
jgi:hypothetical protein